MEQTTYYCKETPVSVTISQQLVQLTLDHFLNFTRVITDSLCETIMTEYCYHEGADVLNSFFYYILSLEKELKITSMGNS